MIIWCISVVALTLLASAWHWTQRAKGYPRNTFLFHQPVRFTDLTNTWHEAARPQPYGQENTTPYFPLVFWLLKCASREKLVTVFRLTYLAVSVSCAVLWSIPWWCTAVVLLAYPALFADDRGNIDHIIGCLSSIAAALLFAGDPIWGAVALGIGIALKGYPAPLGLMWLLQGQWASIGVMATTSLALVALPSRTFEGGIIKTLRGLRHGLGGFHTMASLAPRGPAFAVSHYCFDCLNAIRLVRFWVTGKWPDVSGWTKPYIAFSTAWAALLTWRAATTDQVWVALLALGMFQAIWPYTANDYRLMALVPGIAAWLAVGAPNPVIWWCLLLLWVPKHYWFPDPKESWGSVSCVVSPVLTLVLTAALWM
jgi:hypothetical protein